MPCWEISICYRLVRKGTGHHLEAFQKAHLHVISFNHGARSELLDQQFHQLRLNCFRALGESLDHKHIVVAVNDQRRQQISFRINQTIRIRVRRYLSSSGRFPDPFPPPIAIDGFVLLR